MEAEVGAGKQRENKLLFFLYLLKEEHHFDINKVYNSKKIKDIKTSRFSKQFDDDFEKINQQLIAQQVKQEQAKPWESFELHSND